VSSEAGACAAAPLSGCGWFEADGGGMLGCVHEGMRVVKACCSQTLIQTSLSLTHHNRARGGECGQRWPETTPGGVCELREAFDIERASAPAAPMVPHPCTHAETHQTGKFAWRCRACIAGKACCNLASMHAAAALPLNHLEQHKNRYTLLDRLKDSTMGG
jgi:hypothetical protein